MMNSAMINSNSTGTGSGGSSSSSTSSCSTSSGSVKNNAKARANIQASDNAVENVITATVAAVTTSTTTLSSTPATSTAAISSTSIDSTGSVGRDVALASKPPRSVAGTASTVTVTKGVGPMPSKVNEPHHYNSSNNRSSSSSSNHTTGDSSRQQQRTPGAAHAQEQLSKTNLYIRGLQSNTKDHDLHDMCNRFGHVSSTKAILDKETGCCRGYGFVEFVTAKSAELAVRELTKSGIQAQMAKISLTYTPHGSNLHLGSGGNHHSNHHNNGHNNHHQYGNQKSNKSGGGYNNVHNSSGSLHNHNMSGGSNQKNHADPTNLYIANLPPNMSELELEELLSNYGNIVSTRILRDESNNPRGVGFARMESRDKCEEIIEQLNGRPYKGSSELLVVKFADGGNKKRHHYNNHQHQNNNNNHRNHAVHHSHHKANQDENKWQDNTNSEDLGVAQSYDHQQGNMSHSSQPPDLALMDSIRMQPGFPPSVATGTTYHSQLGPPSSAPQWMHPAGGQPYVVPPHMTQTGGLSPSSQAAAAAAMHYGHIPHLAAQMQGLQISHAAAHLGGYLPPQHQWPTLWPHPIPQQSPTQMGRLPSGPMQTGSASISIPIQHPSQFVPLQQQQSPHIHQSPPQRLAGQQQQRAATIDSKLHV